MEGHQALLKRLEDYDLDNPNSTFPFSAKLAKENGWTPSFTQRAIKEYKRFCYLAMTAGHPVSPSEVVDEVWHMHLIYSQEYWKVFCPQVLQSEFHHYPSTGGKVEKRSSKTGMVRLSRVIEMPLARNRPPTSGLVPQQNRKVQRQNSLILLVIGSSPNALSGFGEG